MARQTRIGTANLLLFFMIFGSQALNSWRTPRSEVEQYGCDSIMPPQTSKTPARGDEDDSLPVIYVDDREFEWQEFGRMLCVHAGWGMRVVFVPDDELERSPKIIVRESEG
jgi:hypothetical protein